MIQNLEGKSIIVGGQLISCWVMQWRRIGLVHLLEESWEKKSTVNDQVLKTDVVNVSEEPVENQKKSVRW